MEELFPITIVVGGFFVLIGFTADAIAQATVRRKIAGKELAPDQIEALLKRRIDPDSLLKWALLTTVVGLGFVALHFLPPDVQREPVAIGLLLILAGGALFLYRSLIRRRAGDEEGV